MTDNRTTELPCPFCGGEAGVYHYTSAIRGDSWRVVCGEPFCAYGPEGYNEAEAIAAWNARATHGTLTAEQVREAVMSVDRWEKPMGNTGLTNTHLIIRDDGWQAIADELNARAERTCRIIEYDEAPYPVCSECGAVQPDDYTVYFCWNCGAKVRDE